MADNKIPTWKETRDRILSQGVKIAELDAKFAEYKATFGVIFGTDDVIYYMMAQKEYGLSMPKFTTLNQTTGGPSVLVGLEEVGFGTNANSVSTTAYLASLEIVDGKKGDNVKATLMDGNAMREMRCYFPERVEDILQTLQVGKTYKFNSLGLFKRQGRDGFPPDALLTWGDRTSAEEVQTNVFVNMREKPLKDGQPCQYEGYVTDEETRTYMGCSQCKKSVKNGPCQKHPGAPAKEIGMYSATVTDGTGKYTASFGSKPPKDGLLHSVVQIVGVFNQQRNEIRVHRYSQITKNAIPKHQDVIAGKPAVTAPITQPNGVVVKNVGPDDILISVVQKYGVSPKQAVVYKLTKDCGMSAQEAEKFLHTRVADGTLSLNGETYKWAK